MANQSNQRPAAKRGGGINANFLGSVFLGICILIAGLNIGSSVRKLNKTVEATTFASTSNVTVPEEMTVESRKYMTESEAAEYLNITEEKVVNLITSGEISEYVKTETGYSISVEVLDAWFDNEAYQTKLKVNAMDTEGGDEDEVSGEE